MSCVDGIGRRPPSPVLRCSRLPKDIQPCPSSQVTGVPSPPVRVRGQERRPKYVSKIPRRVPHPCAFCKGGIPRTQLTGPFLWFYSDDVERATLSHRTRKDGAPSGLRM